MGPGRRAPPLSDTTTRGRAGFTLIELLVTIALIGMALSTMFGIGFNVLPQSRLQASATEIGDTIVQLRNHALFSRRQVIFEYDLEGHGWRAFYPYELDEEGRIVGPGETDASSPGRTQQGMQLESVGLALDGEELFVEGTVRYEISPLGFIASHDVVVVDPEFAEYEALTVRIDSKENGYQILRGRPPRLLLEEADFR